MTPHRSVHGQGHDDGEGGDRHDSDGGCDSLDVLHDANLSE